MVCTDLIQVRGGLAHAGRPDSQEGRAGHLGLGQRAEKQRNRGTFWLAGRQPGSLFLFLILSQWLCHPLLTMLSLLTKGLSPSLHPSFLSASTTAPKPKYNRELIGMALASRACLGARGWVGGIQTLPDFQSCHLEGSQPALELERATHPSQDPRLLWPTVSSSKKPAWATSPRRSSPKFSNWLETL